MPERIVAVDLGDNMKVLVAAEQKGPELVAENEELEAKLTSVTGAVERVGHDLLEAVKRAAPTSATVEVGFGLAIEQGQLVALFGKGKAEATITVTFNWARDDGA
jgi:hypothetical protein